jgi:hypothetical protein
MVSTIVGWLFSFDLLINLDIDNLSSVFFFDNWIVT